MPTLRRRPPEEYPCIKQLRLSRLFNPRSSRCSEVAVEHGFFDNIGFLAGIENLAAAVGTRSAAVRTLVEAGPDAIQLTLGQPHLLQSIPGKANPALVLRVDTANVYGKTLPAVRYNQPIATAVRLDAACICINLSKVPGAPEVQRQCVRNILDILPEAHRLGMPVMVEPLVARGIVYNRHVIQHPIPFGIIRAPMARVHKWATAADAAKLLTAKP